MNATPTETTAGRNGGAVAVGLGCLLSPDDFARECEATIQRPSFSSWALGALLPNHVVESMERAHARRGTGLALMLSSSGPMYPVAVFQADGLQLRVMLSLTDSRAQQWLTDAVTSGWTHLAAEVTETAQLAVLSGMCERRPTSEIEAHVQQCQRLEDPMRRFYDEYMLAERLTEAATLESLVSGTEVTSVYLVLATPDAHRLVKSKGPGGGGGAIH